MRLSAAMTQKMAAIGVPRGGGKCVRAVPERLPGEERLRLLLVLTVADMRATGPTVWNGWKAALLRELYFSAEDRMSGGVLAERRHARVQAAQAALRLELPDWTGVEVADHVALGYPDYWLGLDTATHARHAHGANPDRDGGAEEIAYDAGIRHETRSL